RRVLGLLRLVGPVGWEAPRPVRRPAEAAGGPAAAAAPPAWRRPAPGARAAPRRRSRTVVWASRAGPSRRSPSRRRRAAGIGHNRSAWFPPVVGLLSTRHTLGGGTDISPGRGSGTHRRPPEPLCQCLVLPLGS